MENRQDINELKDKTIVCCDCSNAFTWTSGEQVYYLSKKLQTPRRCPRCRLVRKLTIARQGVQND